MSDTMFYGVLRMPYEMAMSNELSRRQFYSRAQEAADRVEAADKRIAELESRPAAPVVQPHQEPIGHIKDYNKGTDKAYRQVVWADRTFAMDVPDGAAVYAAPFPKIPAAPVVAEGEIVLTQERIVDAQGRVGKWVEWTAEEEARFVANGWDKHDVGQGARREFRYLALAAHAVAGSPAEATRKRIGATTGALASALGVAEPMPASEAAKQTDQAHVMPPFAAPASQLALDVRDAARFRALDKRSRYIERPGYRPNIQGDFPWTTLGAYADRLLKWEPESGSFIAPDAEVSAPAGSDEAPTPTCTCATCVPNSPYMILCATCGNKRCPHAKDHRNTCTNSNEPGQAGSSYEHCAIPDAPAPTDAGIPISDERVTIDSDEFHKLLLSIRDAKHALAISARTEMLIAHIDARLSARAQQQAGVAEEVAGVDIKRLLRNLDDTSYNEGSEALACRLTDCRAVIRALLSVPWEA